MCKEGMNGLPSLAGILAINNVVTWREMPKMYLGARMHCVMSKAGHASWSRSFRTWCQSINLILPLNIGCVGGWLPLVLILDVQNRALNLRWTAAHMFRPDGTARGVQRVTRGAQCCRFTTASENRLATDGGMGRCAHAWQTLWGIKRESETNSKSDAVRSKV